MVTNSFTPLVGGVARSVEAFTSRYRELGHRVLVAAPRFEGAPVAEPDVIRLPAIQHWNGSDFSMPLPITRALRSAMELWRPDVVHSHHPFLLGDTALRIAAAHDVPIVFTHHTRYESYTHYIPGDSPRLRRFAMDLATGYANLCDAVIAPGEGLAAILKERGVEVPVEVIPTGVDVAFFACGQRASFRRRWDIPGGAPLIGYVGRLAPEKNLEFLSDALAGFVQRYPRVHVLVIGEGPCRAEFEAAFAAHGLRRRLHVTGALPRELLPDAYAAMDVFAFASKSETQGMVLTEAMAAGVPVVALDACGVRDVVCDGTNGRLLAEPSVQEFVEALRAIVFLGEAERASLRAAARETAARFSMERTADQALRLYERLVEARRRERGPIGRSAWETARRRLAEEWKILANQATAAQHAWLQARDPPGPLR
jgi:glycosyltransferase involved in cell wall biosynthesis